MQPLNLINQSSNNIFSGITIIQTYMAQEMAEPEYKIGDFWLRTPYVL